MTEAESLEAAVLRALCRKFGAAMQKAKRHGYKVPVDAGRRRYCNGNHLYTARSFRVNNTNRYATNGL